MTIIEINAHEDGSHNLQSRNGAVRVWEDGYLEVPAHLEAKAWESLGWCELVIEDGVLTGITPTERPPQPEPEPTERPPQPEPTVEERLNDIEEAIQRGLSL